MEANDPFENMNQDDLFNLITIDRIRKKKITVTLVDSDGDEIDLGDACREIMDYVTDQCSVKKKQNDKQRVMINQILPLVSQAMCSTLPSLMGKRHAYMTLTQENFRYSHIMMMMLSLTLLKWVNKKTIKIVTHEEDVTDEEIERYEKMSRVSSAATTGAMMGMSPKEIMKDLIESGDISSAEIDDIRGNKKDEDDEPLN